MNTFFSKMFHKKSAEVHYYKHNPLLPDPKLLGNMLMLPSDYEGRINCFTKHLVSTGIRVHVPAGHVGILIPVVRRCIHNVIEILLYNCCRDWWDIQHGQHVASLVIVKTKKINLREIKV